MSKVYTHITKSHKPGTSAILDDYDSEELLNSCVLFNSIQNNYRVFESPQDAAAYILRQPSAQRTFHEVIFGKRRQRLKFDIEADILNVTSAMMQQSLSALRAAIKEVLLTRFEITDYILDEYSSSNSAKHSYHFVIRNYYAQHVQLARSIHDDIISQLDPVSASCIDAGVYKITQNFRIHGCHKGGKDAERVKQRYPVAAAEITEEEITSALISVYDGDNVQPFTSDDSADTYIAKSRDDVKVELGQESVKIALDAALSAVEELRNCFRFRCYHDLILQFDRRCSGMCTICQVPHEHDSTAYVRMSPTSDPTICKLMLCCRRNVDTMEIGAVELNDPDLFKLTTKIDEINSENTSWFEKQIEKYARPQTKHDIAYLFGGEVNFGRNDTYDSATLRDFELTKTLLVRAPMKMGKTKKLAEYITANFAENALIKPIIRILSFREAFTLNVKSKFPEFTVYNQVEGSIKADRVIIQMESLHRLEIGENYIPDLLVMDESESIIDQLSSGLYREFNIAFAKFAWLMANARHVVCMDAFLGQRTMRAVQELRGTDAVILQNNTHKNATDDKYHIYNSEGYWYDTMRSRIQSGEHIAVVCNSLKAANAVYHDITAIYKDLRVFIYSSETSTLVKREHYARVNDIWVKYDVIIYTPTITAGVSFEEKHFSSIFCYFIDNSCNAETCMQMLGRVRDVAKKEYHMFVRANTNNQPVTYNSIVGALTSTRGASNIYFEYNTAGVPKLFSQLKYAPLCIENIRVNNLSLNNFLRRMITLIRYTGASVQYANGAGSNDFDDAKTTAETIENQSVAAAADIDDDEVLRLQMAYKSKIEVTINDIRAITKRELRNHYLINVDDETQLSYPGAIDEQFVSTYKKKSETHTFFPLLRELREFASVADALAHLKDRDEQRLSNIYKNPLIGDNDIIHKYAYAAVNALNEAVKMCGWRDIYDDTIYSVENITAKVGESSSKLVDYINIICRATKVRAPTAVAGKTGEKLVNYLLQNLSRAAIKLCGLAISASSRGHRQLVFSADIEYRRITDDEDLTAITKPLINVYK